MAKQPCAICGVPYNDGHLLFHDRGRICVGCEADLEEAKEVRSDRISATVAGPFLIFLATMFSFGSFIPGLGQILITGTPFLAFLAFVAGLHAFRLAYRGTEADGYTGRDKGLLVASGAVSIVGSIPLTLLACGQLAYLGYGLVVG